MKILKIEINNFYSFKNQVIDLTKYKGITCVDGTNLETGGSNGSGKSSLFEAICFGLTGKTIRKSNEDSLVNSENNQDCYVILEIENEGNYYIIKRGRRPSILHVSINSVDVTKTNITETQDFLFKNLNYDHKSLLATMIFGQNGGLNFIEASKEDKRKIINSYLNLDELFSFKDKATLLKRDSSVELRTFESILENNKAKINSFKEVLDYPKPEYDLKVIREQELNYITATNDLSNLQREESNTVKLLNSVKTTIKSKTCYTCGSEVEDTKFLVEETKLNKKLEEIRNNLKNIKDFIEFNKVPISYKELENQYRKYETSKNSSLIDSLEEENISIVEKLTILKNKIEAFTFWQKAFSEQGIIRSIIQNILDEFNGLVGHYLGILTDGNYTIEFDSTLDEVIFCKDRKVSYISLSGGEKNKVDLATMLGLQRLPSLIGKSDINILLFDEFGGFLDEPSFKNLYILLQELSKSKDLFVITHNKNLRGLLHEANELTIIKSAQGSQIKEDI